MEPAVAAGGPLLALLGFVFLPLVWSIPEAMVTAELSTTFPEPAGCVAWVRSVSSAFRCTILNSSDLRMFEPRVVAESLLSGIRFSCSAALHQPLRGYSQFYGKHTCLIVLCFVRQVSTAFGPFWGWIEGYCSWVSGVADNSLCEYAMSWQSR